jgi:hypothetical protein
MTKKFKDIVKRNPEPAKGKFGINPMDPWSIKSGIAEATDKKDRVTLDIPLLIRVLELAREDIKTDMDLHRVVEKLIQIRNKGVLTMKDYNTIAHIKENHIAIAMGKMLDDEGGMVLTQLEQLERAIAMIRSYVGKDYEKQLPAWVQAKITIATDYADTVGTYLLSKNEKVTEAKDPCWTDYTQVGMKDKGGRQVPNCVPSKGVPKAKGYKEEVMKCKNIKLHETKSCGCYSEEALAEAQSKRMSGADKFRKFMANRDKQNREFMKGIEGKSHAEKMQAMMDKIKSNLNTEEVDLEEAKQHPYKFRATYHDPDTNEVTHYMDFTHRNLEAAKKHAQGSRLQRKDGKEDKLHSVVQMKEEVEQIDELSNKKLLGYMMIAGSKKDPKKDTKDRSSNVMKATSKYLNKEEVEQIDELKKTTVKSWLGQQKPILDKKPGEERKAYNTRTKKRSVSWNRALDRLTGHKPTSEEVNKKEMSKSARMIKALYKKHNMKEDMTDWEKEDKSVQTYGKKPKIQTTPKKDSFGEDKPKAAIIMSGGKTMTGQTRDTVEIDPMLKQRNGPDDFDRNYGKKQPQ